MVPIVPYSLTSLFLCGIFALDIANYPILDSVFVCRYTYEKIMKESAKVLYPDKSCLQYQTSSNARLINSVALVDYQFN